jgi:hypothetical protein
MNTFEHLNDVILLLVVILVISGIIRYLLLQRRTQGTQVRIYLRIKGQIRYK